MFFSGLEDDNYVKFEVWEVQTPSFSYTSNLKNKRTERFRWSEDNNILKLIGSNIVDMPLPYIMCCMCCLSSSYIYYSI